MTGLQFDWIGIYQIENMLLMFSFGTKTKSIQKGDQLYLAP